MNITIVAVEPAAFLQGREPPVLISAKAKADRTRTTPDVRACLSHKRECKVSEAIYARDGGRLVHTHVRGAYASGPSRCGKGPRRIPELADQVADELGLSAEDREAPLPSGRQRLLHNRLHWAKFYMTKAGLIEAPQREVFTATAAGRALLDQNPKKIDRDLLFTYPTFQAFYHGQKADAGPLIESTTQADDLTPEERIDQSARALDQIVRADLIDWIGKGSPAFFEDMIVDLLVAMGYGGSHADAAKRIGKSGDGGVDGVISEDRLGLDRIYVQAKRYAAGNVVGRPEIQSFVRSLVVLGSTKGVFVTTSSFSQQAREYARLLTQRVVLTDGAELSGLMIEHGVGVRTAHVIELNRVDENYFTEDA